MSSIGVIILAAGQGTRMKSDLPKVLHPLGGRPLFLHPLEIAQKLGARRIAVVIGHGADAVKRAYSGSDVSWVVQEKQLGTGHAVGCARDCFDKFNGELLILSGDVPLIQQQTLTALIARHRDDRVPLTLMTAMLGSPTGYGRILRDDSGAVSGIVEEKDADETQRRVREVNAGVYVADPQFLFEALASVKNNNRQGEYYLPDAVTVALAQGKKVATFQIDDPREMLGINTREELAQMETIFRDAGVTLKDPATTYIDAEVTIGRDTVIGPNTQLCGKTAIGAKCRLDGNAFITDAQIGDEVYLRFSVVLTGCRVERGAIIGPFAHLRPGTDLGPNVHIGNFVETKDAKLAEGTKANHLTYLGDCTIGRETNIGAGTITCNYDGFNKYKTTIGDRVQVGSDTTLVAPIKLGNDVYVATASTVRHDIPDGALVFNERQERVRDGWTEQKRNQMRGKKK
jgi:bifunctional UDP-N-acetylglucosamine pyrophosphorylase/glucosamine-1-phosphate N-acetyltransferase